MDRKRIFKIELTYLIVLLFLGLTYFTHRTWLFFVPISFGPIPLGVPWFGALGGVLISLAGVFEHEHDWDDDFWPWHVARPLIGASVGMISFLIFKTGALAVGPTGNAAEASSNLLYCLIAFVVGYREETFRELIKRLADVLLTPGNPGGQVPTITGVNPSTAPHGTATPVVVTGKNLKGTTSVKFGDTPGQIDKADSDTQLTVTTPVMTGAVDVNMVLTTKAGSAAFPFKFN